MFCHILDVVHLLFIMCRVLALYIIDIYSTVSCVHVNSSVIR